MNLYHRSSTDGSEIWTEWRASLVIVQPDTVRRPPGRIVAIPGRERSSRSPTAHGRLISSF
jgi:hypothetical protein